MWKFTGFLATAWISCVSLGIGLEYLYVNLNGCATGDLMLTCMSGPVWGAPKALYLFAINSIVYASPVNFILSGLSLAYWTDRMLWPARSAVAVRPV